MEITYDSIFAISRIVLSIGCGVSILLAVLAKEESAITRYNTEAILCYILAQGI